MLARRSFAIGMACPCPKHKAMFHRAAAHPMCDLRGLGICSPTSGGASCGIKKRQRYGQTIITALLIKRTLMPCLHLVCTPRMLLAVILMIPLPFPGYLAQYGTTSYAPLAIAKVRQLDNLSWCFFMHLSYACCSHNHGGFLHKARPVSLGKGGIEKVNDSD